MKNENLKLNEAKIKSAIIYEQLFEPIFQQFARAAIELVNKNTEGRDVLDIAAGTGALSLLAAKQGANVLAVDISPEMLHRLHVRVTPDLNCAVQVMDGQQLDIPSASYDLSFSIFGVMTFPDWRKGMQELARVTRKDGNGIVAVFDKPQGIMTPYMEAYEAAFPERNIPPLPEGMQVLSSIKRLEIEMTEAGFTNVDVHEVTRTRQWQTIDDFLKESTTLCCALFFLYIGLDAAERTHFDSALRKTAEKHLTNSGTVHIPVGVLIAIGRR